MTTKVAKVNSFSVNDSNPNALVPLDDQDKNRPFETIVTISQGWRWRIARTDCCESKRQPNGRLSFSVKIEYLDGPNKGKTRQGIVTDYDPAGRYGKIQKK